MAELAKNTELGPGNIEGKSGHSDSIDNVMAEIIAHQRSEGTVGAINSGQGPFQVLEDAHKAGRFRQDVGSDKLPALAVDIRNREKGPQGSYSKGEEITLADKERSLLKFSPPTKETLLRDFLIANEPIAKKLEASGDQGAIKSHNDIQMDRLSRVLSLNPRELEALGKVADSLQAGDKASLKAIMRENFNHNPAKVAAFADALSVELGRRGLSDRYKIGVSTEFKDDTPYKAYFTVDEPALPAADQTRTESFALGGRNDSVRISPETWLRDKDGKAIEAGEKFKTQFDESGKLVKVEFDNETWEYTAPNEITLTTKGREGEPDRQRVYSNVRSLSVGEYANVYENGTIRKVTAQELQSRMHDREFLQNAQAGIRVYMEYGEGSGSGKSAQLWVGDGYPYR